MGNFDPKLFITKVRETFASMPQVSPYFYEADRLSQDNKISLNLSATALGRKEDNVVFRSEVELASSASMVCVPEDKTKGPVLLKMPSSLNQDNKFYNLFPISRLKGQGLQWINALPPIQVGESGKTKRKVLFYDPNSVRAEQYKEVLSGYDIELVTTSNLSSAAALFQRSSDEFSCVFLYELVSDAGGIAWKKAYDESGKTIKVPVIIGTTSNGAKSTTEIRYIRKPFGLGVLVETLEASFVRASELEQTENAGGMQNMPVFYQAPGKLIGFDETGGVIELKFPMPVGTKVEVKHPLITRVLPGVHSLRISAIASLEGSSETWQVRFESLEAGLSKQKYWEKTSALLSQLESETKPSNSSAVA